MRLKSITAPDTTRALAEIRAVLGQDAVIVSRQDLEDGAVRITAAVENEDLDLADLLAPAACAEVPWLAPLADHHGLQGGLLDRLRQALAGSANAEPEAALGQALHGLFRFAPLPLDGPPLLLVGPPGAGKTASVAKLAARAVLAGTAVRVVTADVERSGGVAQLAALTRPLGIEVRPAADPEALRACVRGAGPELVLVDTPGLNPFRPADIGRLSGLIEATGGVAILVLPAGLVPADCADIAHTVRALGIGLLLPTKLDAARRLGGLLAAADAGLAFTEAGIGPTIGRGLGPLAPAGLAKLLLHAQMPRRRSTDAGGGGGRPA